MEKLKIFAVTIEESAIAQIEEMNNCEAYNDCMVRIMPDCHTGKGCTIGTVIRIRRRVIPNTVGVDIGCGMYFCELDVDAEIDLKKLDEVVNRNIPAGKTIHDIPVAAFPKAEELRCRSVIDTDMLLKSIGSLGGGNHFIELNKTSAGDHYFLVIHTGSRNLGVRVCGYYQRLAEKYCKVNMKAQQELIARLKTANRQSDIQTELKKLRPLVENIQMSYIEESDLDDYIHDMQIVQDYACLNREAIAKLICEKMNWKIVAARHTIHNYIDMETLVLRKGAVRANRDEILIIPMNMRDGSLICRGKGNSDWLFSAPHGAGRLMSRQKAIDSLSMEEYEREMSSVYSTSVCVETIDESPMAYKPMQEIIDCISETVEVLDIIKPVYNFKAKNNNLDVKRS